MLYVCPAVKNLTSTERPAKNVAHDNLDGAILTLRITGNYDAI